MEILFSLMILYSQIKFTEIVLCNGNLWKTGLIQGLEIVT